MIAASATRNALLSLVLVPALDVRKKACPVTLIPSTGSNAFDTSISIAMASVQSMICCIANAGNGLQSLCQVDIC